MDKKLPIARELEPERWLQHLEDIREMAAHIHDELLPSSGNEDGAVGMYTRIYLGYTVEGIDKAITSIRAMQKHIAENQTGLTELVESCQRADAL